MLALLIAVVAVSLCVVAVFALALAKVAAKPTPPVCGPVGEDHDA